MPDEIDLSLDEIRRVTAWAATCARSCLAIFERIRPAWDAHRAAQEAREANQPAAQSAARAAGHSTGAAYLHPLAKATQVHHILGSAAQTARALELDDGTVAGTAFLDTAIKDAPQTVVDVLTRYPAAPPGGGRVGELTRALDAALRAR